MSSKERGRASACKGRRMSRRFICMTYSGFRSHSMRPLICRDSRSPRLQPVVYSSANQLLRQHVGASPPLCICLNFLCPLIRWISENFPSPKIRPPRLRLCNVGNSFSASPLFPSHRTKCLPFSFNYIRFLSRDCCVREQRSARQQNLLLHPKTRPPIAGASAFADAVSPLQVSRTSAPADPVVCRTSWARGTGGTKCTSRIEQQQ